MGTRIQPLPSRTDSEYIVPKIHRGGDQEEGGAGLEALRVEFFSDGDVVGGGEVRFLVVRGTLSAGEYSTHLQLLRALSQEPICAQDHDRLRAAGIVHSDGTITWSSEVLQLRTPLELRDAIEHALRRIKPVQDTDG